MSRKLTSNRAIIRALQRAGWRMRWGKGDHAVLYCPDGQHQVTVSRNAKGNRWRAAANRSMLSRLRCSYVPQEITR